MSKTYSQSPSALLGLRNDPDDAYVAYCLDEAIFFFGSHVENELNEAEENTRSKSKGAKKSARQRVMSKYLTKAEEAKGAFADPAKFLS